MDTEIIHLIVLVTVMFFTVVWMVWPNIQTAIRRISRWLNRVLLLAVIGTAACSLPPHSHSEVCWDLCTSKHTFGCSDEQYDEMTHRLEREK